MVGTGRAPKEAGTPASGAEDERDLIAALLRRDRKAAARFVEEHIDAVYAYVRYRLAPRADLVDDVVQDVFLASLNGLAAFQGQSSLRVWLLGIARHKIEDVYRQRLRSHETGDGLDSLGEGPAAPQPPPDERLDGARARARARRVLAQMPEPYALILIWKYWEGRSAREMAAATGVTEKSVERTLARARSRFRELWLKE